MESESSEVGSRFRAVILTVLRWVFICMSTPMGSMSDGCKPLQTIGNEPVIVPWITEPFLSSTVTVSLLSFMRNLRVKGICTAMFNKVTGEK